MGVSRTDNSVKIWQKLPISNLQPDLHNINAYTKFGENPSIDVYSGYYPETKTRTDGWTDGHTEDTRTSNVKP